MSGRKEMLSSTLGAGNKEDAKPKPSQGCTINSVSKKNLNIKKNCVITHGIVLPKIIQNHSQKNTPEVRVNTAQLSQKELQQK